MKEVTLWVIVPVYNRQVRVVVSFSRPTIRKKLAFKPYVASSLDGKKKNNINLLLINLISSQNNILSMVMLNM